MSKEFEKFQKDYAKVSGKLKEYAKAAVDDLTQNVEKTYTKSVIAGKAHLAERTAAAREEGVVGDKIQDFMKNKTFTDALMAYDKSVEFAKVAIDKVNALAKDAADTADKLRVIAKAIEKDMKSRNDKSATKSDIGKLAVQIGADIDICDYARSAPGRLTKNQLDYVGNFQKNVDEILKEAPEVQKDKLDKTMMPQMLVERNLKRSKIISVNLAKSILSQCDAALIAAETDLKSAAPILKQAATALAELKKIAEDHAKALGLAQRNLATSSQKDFVEETVALMQRAYESAEKRLRGVASTIKKAG